MVRICVDIPKDLHERFKKLVSKGVISGSIDDVIIDVLEDYITEIEVYESAKEVIE